jgi:opacity protein-like surface antigen
MKFKTIIAVSLAVATLFTMASPALADSAKGALTPSIAGETGTGTATIATTHQDYYKVTASLRGGMPNTTYEVWAVIVGGGYYGSSDMFLTTDKRGSGRVSYTIPVQMSGEVSFVVQLMLPAGGGGYFTHYESPPLTVTFR